MINFATPQDLLGSFANPQAMFEDLFEKGTKHTFRQKPIDSGKLRSLGLQGHDELKVIELTGLLRVQTTWGVMQCFDGLYLARREIDGNVTFAVLERAVIARYYEGVDEASRAHHTDLRCRIVESQRENDYWNRHTGGDPDAPWVNRESLEEV